MRKKISERKRNRTVIRTEKKVDNASASGDQLKNFFEKTLEKAREIRKKYSDKPGVEKDA
jgi:hypothetical protein